MYRWMNGWRRCISEPSPDGRGPKWKLVSREIPCCSTVKGLSLSHTYTHTLSLFSRYGGAIKSSTEFCIPSAIARSIDPSLHLIIQSALHYPNYSRSMLSVLDFIDPFRCSFWFSRSDIFIYSQIFYKSAIVSAQICLDFQVIQKLV